MISGRECCIRGDSKAEFLLIQPADEYELGLLENEISYIEKAAAKKFLFAAFKINDWNGELSPWAAPPVRGDEPFSGGADKTLKFISEELIPELREKYLLSPGIKIVVGGYSLAALFSLWAVYKTDIFYGAAAASPSVWFEGWREFAEENRPHAEKIYLSLGNKEEKTRNRIMAAVGENIRALYCSLSESVSCVLRINEGNHFAEPDTRTAKAFLWVIGD